MKLLTKELIRKIPKLYAQDGEGWNAIAYVKFFALFSDWTWFVTEYDGEETFFGLVIGHEAELGYFSLSELQSLDWRIERDLYFTPTPINELMVQYQYPESKAA
jgi:Protein of unknown function (DUF2958)